MRRDISRISKKMVKVAIEIFTLYPNVWAARLEEKRR